MSGETPRLDLRGLTGAQGKTGRDRPWATGLAANRPAANMVTPDSFYYATDTGVASYSDGTTWTNVSAAGYEYSYAEITADATISATVEASAATVVSSAAVTYDGATIIRVEVFAARMECGAGGTLVANLWDGSTDLGRLAVIGPSISTELYAVRRLTPSAASHTYHLKAWRGTADGTIRAASPYLPCFIRITRV